MQGAHNDKKNIACAIFAGGRNSRMGRHKAFLDIGGRRFIDAIIDHAKVYFDEIFIVADDKELFISSGLPVFRDIIPQKGPLGALHTALSLSKAERVFCIACDMPFRNEPLIKRLIRESERSGFDCFVPYRQSRPEPLFAIYRKGMKDLVEKELISGRLSVNKMLNKCRTRFIERKMSEGELVNINTPEEYERYAGKIKDLA